MINKLRNKKGSALQVALIAMLLVGTCSTVVTNMVVNQIKSTHKKTENVNEKYDTEEYVEEVIGDFIGYIDANGVKVNKVNVNMNVVDLYVKLADLLVESKGNLSQKIDEINNKLMNQNKKPDTDMDTETDPNANKITEQDKKDLIKAFNDAISATDKGNANPHAGDILEIGLAYTQFIFNNMLDADGYVTTEKMNYVNCNQYIAMIREHLSEKEMITLKNAPTQYGNVAVGYRDTNLNNKSNSNLQGLNNSFNKTNGDIHKSLLELSKKTDNASIAKWLKDNNASLTDKIKKTNYEKIINNEKVLIGDSGYLYTNGNGGKNLGNFYKTTGNITYEKIVKQRLDIIKAEIDMLIEWLNFMQGLGSDGSDEIITSEEITMSIPKKIEVKDITTNNILGKTISVTIDESRSNDVEELEGDTNYYKYKILEGIPKIIIQLDIIGTSNDYNTRANVEVEIHNIRTSKDYKIDYRINDWKKA